MQRSDYDTYVQLFERRDYDAVIAHFTADAVVRFAGITLRGRAAIKSFYAFFHAYIVETIHVSRFASSDELLAIEAVARLEAKADLTREVLDQKGYHQIPEIRSGKVVEIPQFIHYRMRDGLFIAVTCLIAE